MVVGCVCANIEALQETLRSVCIFSQSDWSKTQPLMYHFKWTLCPNENTHTYKPHLIEGYRFSHSRQFFFFFFFFFSEREKRVLFEINILNLFSRKLKLPFSGWCHQGERRETDTDKNCSSKLLYFKQRKDWNIILHYLKNDWKR